MRVYELMELLSKMPAGAKVNVSGCFRNKDVDKIDQTQFIVTGKVYDVNLSDDNEFVNITKGQKPMRM